MSDSLLEGHLHRGCGGRYVRHTEPVTIRVSGMTASVERVFYSCSRCDDEHRTVEQREAAERAAVEAVRLEHSLLQPRQIRRLREELGLTTEQLGDILYGIPRSIVEGWEKGRYVQNREVNAMLLKLEDADFLRERAARAGVVLPEPAVSEKEAAENEAAGAPDEVNAQGMTDAQNDTSANGDASVPAELSAHDEAASPDDSSREATVR